VATNWKREEIGFTGISFPFRLTPSGMVATSTVSLDNDDMQHISEAIVQVVRTIRGERVMRRGWGAALINAVFRANTETEMLWMASEIQDLLNEYEPRVSLIEAVMVQTDPEQGYVKLRLGFRHNVTQITDYIEVTL